MNKELEEAITRLKKDMTKPLACGDITIVCIDDLETVLNYISNSISKEVIEKKLKDLLSNEKLQCEWQSLSGDLAVRLAYKELLEEQ